MIDWTVFSLPFFQRALLAGLVLGVLLAVLGVIIVIRRMSFFSDAIGHSALTGIALGVLLNFNPYLAAFFYSLLVAASIATLRFKTKLSLDTLLGVFFSASVALGVILVQLTPGFRTDLIAYLFGDILTVSQTDIYVTFVIAAVASVVLLLSGKKFIAIAFDPALAQAEGVAVKRYEMILLLLLAAVIAVSIKLVGVILITAMLIIPAATAQNLARSLTAMFIMSIVSSLLAVVIGMFGSVFLDAASGPTIVLSGALLFALSLFGRFSPKYR